MKNLLKALFFLAYLVVARSVSAQQMRSLSPVWLEAETKNLQSFMLDKDADQAKNFLDEVFNMPAEKRKKELDKYTVPYTDLYFTEAHLGVLKGDRIEKVKTVQNMQTVLFLRLEKKFGSDYKGQLFPMFAYQGSQDMLEYNLPLVYWYDLNADGKDDSHFAREGKKGIVIPDVQPSNQQAVASQQTSDEDSGLIIMDDSDDAGAGSGTNTVSNSQTGQAELAVGQVVKVDGVNYSYMGKDKFGGLIYVPFNQFTHTPSDQPTSGNSNPGGNVGGNTSGSSKKAKASRTVSLEEEGDSTMLVKLDAQGQQGGGHQDVMQMTGGLPVYQLDKGPGKPWYFTNMQTGRPELAPVPTEELVFQEMDGHTFAFGRDENGKLVPVASGKTNAYKNGMGQFAGYQGNYYRHALNGAPLGSNNGPVRFLPVNGTGFGCGCPGVQPGPTFSCQNGYWIDGGSWRLPQGNGGGGIGSSGRTQGGANMIW